jgi:competence protein ComEC
MSKKSSKAKYSAVISAIAVLAIGLYFILTNIIPVQTVPDGSVLKVTAIDVGQADSILISTGSDAMLIDAGNNADASTVVNYIKGQGITKLEYVIGTHPHEDHIGGTDAVINTFDIGTVILPDAQSNTETFKDVLSAISSKGLKITKPVPGATYKLGNANFTVLAPNSSKYDDLNNYSVVIRLVFGSNSFLFMGDAQALSEKEILANGYDVKSDYMKVGHHGSDTSTLDKFLNAVNPEYAVISVGKDNDYGHPMPKTIQKLTNAGIKIYRTDERGTIVATSDGKIITFSTSK